MSEQREIDRDTLDIERVRRNDAVCRRFEAYWHKGGWLRVEDYLAKVPERGRPAQRAELNAQLRDDRLYSIASDWLFAWSSPRRDAGCFRHRVARAPGTKGGCGGITALGKLWPETHAVFWKRWSMMAGRWSL